MEAVIISFLYFLFDRELSFTLHSEELISVHVFLSELFTVLMCSYVLFFTKKRKKFLYYSIIIFLPFFAMLISAYFKEGDYWVILGWFYPILGMLSLLLIKCVNREKTIYFIRVIANLYLLLLVVNFVFLVFYPDCFLSDKGGGDAYFLGLENQIGYPILKGLCFILLDYFFTKGKMRLYVYLIIHVCTLLIIFSGSNLIGLFCMLLFLFCYPFKEIVSSISLNKILIVIVSMYIVVFVFGNLSSLLKLDISQYIIVDVLGKDDTLSGRTAIWDMAIHDFFDDPLLGHGAQADTNVFYFPSKNSRGVYLSAHNQVLQSLYECGLLQFIFMIPLIRVFGQSLKKSERFVDLSFKSTFICTFIMYMGEAPGLNKIFYIMVIAIVISNVFKRNLSKNVKPYI